MNQPIHTFPSPKAVCIELTKYLISELIKPKQGDINIAVSGGTSPKLLFELWATAYRNELPWDRLRIFWVDERCVPPSHPDSNFAMTNKALLSHVPIPAENIFRIQGEQEPSLEVKRYSHVLKKEVPAKKNIPQFDIILLGMGNDGHTASIFPDQLHLLEDNQFCAVGIHTESRQKRITLTGKVINQAKKILFLVTGKEKKEMLKQVVQVKNQTYPASYIRHAAWYTDIEF